MKLWLTDNAMVVAMPGQAQENFPLQRMDLLFRPNQDDYEKAKERARRLLRSILPDTTWSDFQQRGVIQVGGKRGTYLISPYSQTEIRDSTSGRCLAYACLQLSIPAPTYDRMVAEYLLIKNSEDFYWKTANVFSRSGNEVGIARLFLIALNAALLVNLFLKLLA